MIQKISGITFLLCLFAVLHGVFAWHYRDQRVFSSALGPPPPKVAQTAASFGDEQFLYRIWGLNLQNAGDTGGQVTRMSDYNYDHVVGWLTALQNLDAGAQFHSFLATRYFSLSQDLEDVRKVVGFIEGDVMLNPARKWFWLTQAVEIADHDLGNTEYALELAIRLASYDYPGMPGWVWMYPTVLLEKLGRFEEAKTFLREVLREKASRLTPDDLIWADQVTQRLSNRSY